MRGPEDADWPARSDWLSRWTAAEGWHTTNLRPERRASGGLLCRPPLPADNGTRVGFTLD